MLFLHILFSQLNTIQTCISVNMSKFLEHYLTYYKIEIIGENKYVGGESMNKTVIYHAQRILYYV